MAQRKPTKANTPPKAPYVPTEREKAALALNAARKAAHGPTPSMNVIGNKGCVTNLKVDHPDDHVGEALFNESLGLTNGGASALVTELLANLCVHDGKVSQNVLDRYLGIVQEVGPRDIIETMLASQMAAVYLLAMTTAAPLHSRLSPDARDRAVNQLTKLNRTFTTQMEALKRYRSKGEQKVVVEHQHVHVYPGGQAVVGTVNQGTGGGGQEKSGGQPHERNEGLRIPEGSTVLSLLQADQAALQGAGDEGQERLQVPRRESGSALGAG